MAISTSSLERRPEAGAPEEPGEGRAGNWLLIRARGTKSNRYGLGATLRIQTAEGLQVREITSAASYLAGNDVRLHVGVGAAKIVQRLEVLWPSGTKQTLTDVAANQILVIDEAK